MRLMLVRHGQTPSNVAGALDTAHPGASLSTLGQRQAAALPAALATEPVAEVYASTLLRAQLTARPLAQARDLTVHVLDGLEEISAGELEMRTDAAAVQAYLDCHARWITGDLGSSLPGGESGARFLDRFDTAVEAIARRHATGEAAVVVSHGAALRVWAATRVAGVDARPGELHLRNTGCVVADGDPAGGWRLVRWHADPLGGAHLLDAQAHDVTGDGEDGEDGQDG